jgi:hypothetical protein
MSTPGTVAGQPDESAVQTAGSGVTVHLPFAQLAVDLQYGSAWSPNVHGPMLPVHTDPSSGKRAGQSSVCSTPPKPADPPDEDTPPEVEAPLTPPAPAPLAPAPPLPLDRCAPVAHLDGR